MNFLPAVPLFSIADNRHYSGAIAINCNGTRFASIDDRHCVSMYSVDGTGLRTAADSVVYGTPGSSGRAHGQLDAPFSVCFVHRNGMDTLLI
jgi:hypothetical protein